MKRQIERYIMEKFQDFGLENNLAENVIQVLEQVDEVYKNSEYQKRRTGEGNGCHPYRAVAEFIHWADLVKKSGKDIDFFEENGLRPFYLGCLVTALHDAGEDLMGGHFKIINGLAIRLSKGKAIILREIGLSEREIEVLEKMGEALTKPPKTKDGVFPEERARQKFEKLRKLAGELDVYGVWPKRIPWIIKAVADSRDNLRTEFELVDEKAKKYSLRRDKVKLASKLREKIRYYGEIDMAIREWGQVDEEELLPVLEDNELIAHRLAFGIPPEKIFGQGFERLRERLREGNFALGGNEFMAQCLFRGISFESMLGRCFKNKPEGRLAFFDPFSRVVFEFAREETVADKRKAA